MNPNIKLTPATQQIIDAYLVKHAGKIRKSPLLRISEAKRNDKAVGVDQFKDFKLKISDCINSIEDFEQELNNTNEEYSDIIGVKNYKWIKRDINHLKNILNKLKEIK